MGMKWSLCSTGFKERSIEEAAVTAARLGLNGIEIWSGHIEAYVQQGGTAEGLRERLSGLGLEVPMLSPYTYWSASEEECAKELEEIERAMQWAVALGCPMVRTFAGRVASARTEPEQQRRMLHYLRRALDLADQYDLYVALEIHNGTFADRSETTRSIIREADHPRLKLIFDGFNLFVDGLGQMAALTELYPWIGHVHLKNYRWNRADWSASVPTPVMAGDLDQRELLEALLEHRYASFVSFEYFGDQAERCIRESLDEVKKLTGGS